MCKEHVMRRKKSCCHRQVRMGQPEGSAYGRTVVGDTAWTVSAGPDLPRFSRRTDRSLWAGAAHLPGFPSPGSLKQEAPCVMKYSWLGHGDSCLLQHTAYNGHTCGIPGLLVLMVGCARLGWGRVISAAAWQSDTWTLLFPQSSRSAPV